MMAGWELKKHEMFADVQCKFCGRPCPARLSTLLERQATLTDVVPDNPGTSAEAVGTPYIRVEYRRYCAPPVKVLI
jgi:hypothetical protein